MLRQEQTKFQFAFHKHCVNVRNAHFCVGVVNYHTLLDWKENSIITTHRQSLNLVVMERQHRQRYF